jgi:hypothetical protein
MEIQRIAQAHVSLDKARTLRITTSCDNLVALLCILPTKLKSQAAVGTGDQ